jgi:hypothetical protein
MVYWFPRDIQIISFQMAQVPINLLQSLHMTVVHNISEILDHHSLSQHEL